MTDDDTSTGAGGTSGCGCTPAPEGCDTSMIDDLACRAAGVAAQAAYDASYQAALDAGKQAYDTVRKAYRSRRQEAHPVVQQLGHQLAQLQDRVRCLIKQKRVWRCLDEAFCEVVQQLDECQGEGGCCVGECDVDLDDLEQLDLAQVLALIATYQQRTDAARACFDQLSAEPDALAARVAALQAAVAAIEEALGGDPAVIDLKQVYVDVLVATRDQERVWGGFDQTQDFVECLCRALTCWATGCAAVSLLTGRRAVLECWAAAAEQRCTDLRDRTTEEVLAVYDRRCASPCDDGGGHDGGGHDHDGGGDDHDGGGHDHDDGCDDDEDEDDGCGGDDDEDDHDCGCGHHNHHHRQRGCRCRCHEEPATVS